MACTADGWRCRRPVPSNLLLEESSYASDPGRLIASMVVDWPARDPVLWDDGRRGAKDGLDAPGLVWPRLCGVGWGGSAVLVGPRINLLRKSRKIRRGLGIARAKTAGIVQVQMHRWRHLLCHHVDGWVGNLGKSS